MFEQPFTMPALLIFLLMLPLILGLIPPNRWYGVRTKQIQANAEHWYQVNRYAGLTLSIAGVEYLIIAWIVPCTVNGQTDLWYWLLHLVVFAGTLLVSGLLIGSYLRRLPS